jgi:hypothetical protein
MIKKKRHRGSGEMDNTKYHRNFSTLEALQAVAAPHSGIKRRVKFAIATIADFSGCHSGWGGF